MRKAIHQIIRLKTFNEKIMMSKGKILHRTECEINHINIILNVT